jgi:hypothetical protein
VRDTVAWEVEAAAASVNPPVDDGRQRAQVTELHIHT